MRAVCFGFALAATAIAGGAAASPLPQLKSDPDGVFRAAFDVHVGGFEVGLIESDSRIDAGRYRQAIAFETAGMLAWFVEGRSVSVSEGVIEPDGRVRAERFENEGVWNDERRTIRLAFDAEGGVAALDLAPPPDGDREPVPSELRRGPDPLSLVIAAALSPRAGAVERSETSFDGKRAMRFAWRCAAGDERMSGRGADVYGGVVRACAVEGEQIGGFHEKYRNNNLNPPRPAKLWLAPVDGGAFYAPVKLTMDTRFGGLVATLTRVGPAPAGEAPTN